MDVDKAPQPARFTDVSLGIRDAEVCLTCHTVLDEPDDWPEDQEWSYPLVQVPWPCPARVEIDRLRAALKPERFTPTGGLPDIDD